MKIRTHLKLSRDIRYFIQRFTSSELNPVMFSLGNILPDVAIHMRLMGHTKKHSYAYLLKRIRSLYKKRHRSHAYISMKLGVITHYLADYFCHPHTELFEGSINDHRVYEVGLARYVAKKNNLLPHHVQIDTRGGFKATIDRLYDEYIKMEQSFENDVQFAIKAARSVALSLAPMPEPIPTLSDAIALSELQPVQVGEAG